MKTATATTPVRLQDDAVALHEALSELVRVYQFRDRDRICCYDVSVTQCYALEAVIARDGITMGELAAGLFLDKSTASRVVDALERKGYVTRKPHPRDRRAVSLEATAAGRKLHAKIEHDLVDEAGHIVRDFAPEVRRDLVTLVRRLAGAATARSCSPGGCTPQ